MSAESAIREEEPETEAPAAPTPEASVVDTPAPPPTTPSEDPLSDLLREYDEGTASTEPAPTNGAASPQQDELESLLSQLGQQQRQASESASENARLQQELGGWKGAAEQATQMLQAVQQILWREGERAAFDKFAGEVQARLPNHLPSNFAELWLKNAANNDPALAIAWDARNANPMAIQVEIDRVQRIMAYLMANPTADHSKFPPLPQLEEHWRKLNIAARSKDILREARGRLLEEARKNPPIDEEATLDREAVTFAVRSAGNGKMPSERAPNLGQMSDRELKDYTRQFGF